MIKTNYYEGGLKIAPPGNNRSEEWDFQAKTYTSWDRSGAQTSQRSLKPDEVALLATETRFVNKDALASRGGQALATNATYLAQPAIPASPTLVQLTAAVRVIRAQVDALTRQANSLIKLALSDLDDISGT